MKKIPVEIISVTIRQKESITHTKFIITGDGTPFPEDNFDLAKRWMEQGLLDDKAAAFVRTIMDGSIRDRLRVAL